MGAWRFDLWNQSQSSTKIIISRAAATIIITVFCWLPAVKFIVYLLLLLLPSPSQAWSSIVNPCCAMSRSNIKKSTGAIRYSHIPSLLSVGSSWNTKSRIKPVTTINTTTTTGIMPFSIKTTTSSTCDEKVSWMGNTIGLRTIHNSSKNTTIATRDNLTPTPAAANNKNNNDNTHETAEDTNTLALPQWYMVQWEVANASASSSSPDSTTMITFPAQRGELLRTAALKSGLVSPHNGRANLINCRGLGTCGTCAVTIQSGLVRPIHRNLKEQIRLALPPHNQKWETTVSVDTRINDGNQRSDETIVTTTTPINIDTTASQIRLACQIQVEGDLIVRKMAGFWGQDSVTLATLSQPTQPLGELEYCLDQTSPSRTKDDEPR